MPSYGTDFLYCGFLVSCVIFYFCYCFILFCLFVMRVPLHTLGPPGGFMLG